MKAMILAAGLGTRLGNLTREIPKPMLDIGGKPLLEYNLRHLVRHGFNQIMINLHFLPEVIKSFTGNGSLFGAKISYSYEETLLGTAGAIKKVEEFWGEGEPFLVLYGDILTDQNLGALYRLHIEKQALATIIVHQRASSNSLVCLEEGGRISGFVERPSQEERAKYPYNWVNSGIQVLSPELLKEIPAGTFCDLPKNIYPALAEKNGLFGLPLSGRRVAIDSAQRYEQAVELAKEMNL